MPEPHEAALEASLRRLRWTTIGTLGVCALLSWLQTRETSSLPPALAAAALPVAIVLAAGIMAARQVALRAQAPRTRLYALLTTYLSCIALGVFGAVLSFAGDDGSRGALFALGGAIFTLGSPPGLGRPGA